MTPDPESGEARAPAAGAEEGALGAALEASAPALDPQAPAPAGLDPEAPDPEAPDPEGLDPEASPSPAAEPQRSLGDWVFSLGPPRPGLAAALWGLALAFGATLLTGDQERRGLGFWLDDGPLDGLSLGGELLRGGAVPLQRVVLDARGSETVLLGHASLGAELVALGVYAALGLIAGLLLARGCPRLLAPRGARATLRALGWLTPLFLLGGSLALLVGAAYAPKETTSALLRLQRPILALAPSALLFALRFVLLGPLAEELLWRGLVYRGLRARLTPVSAAVVCALAFAVWHFLVGWRAFPVLAVHYGFSLLACRLTEESESLWPALVLHGLGNGCALLCYALATAYPNELLYVLGLPR